MTDFEKHISEISKSDWNELFEIVEDLDKTKDFGKMQNNKKK
jgi:hypothetical protein